MNFRIFISPLSSRREWSGCVAAMPSGCAIHALPSGRWLIRTRPCSVSARHRHLCQVMLGNLNAASKEFWRWKVNQEIDEDRKAAKAAGDFRALAVMQKNRIKNNRTDTPDEPELAFDKIVPVEFRMTDDPTVIGLQKIPNLRAKIKKMEKRYSMPDIEDADFEELPPDDDSKT